MGVADTRRRSCVVRLIQNKQRSGSELTEDIAQTSGVNFVSQQAVRDDEARARCPWVYRETAGDGASRPRVPYR